MSKKYKDSHKGNISRIRLNGTQTDLVPIYLNVPLTSKPIPEGPCTFQCSIDIKAFRTNQQNYVRLRGGTLRTNRTEPRPNPKAANSIKQKLWKIWGVNSCRFIGYYHYDKKEHRYVVDDIRKPNFDFISHYPDDPNHTPIRIVCPTEIRGITPNDYYHFAWKLTQRNPQNPYEIGLDFAAQRPAPIDPEKFINTLYEDCIQDTSKNFARAGRYLDTLSKQFSAKKYTFVYELLQNANDYPVEGQLVDVEFHITDKYLLLLHSGAKFNVRNISAICSINEKEKDSNRGAIGYKGIGFKTVFFNNPYVYLRTGAYSFRFDKEAIERQDAPFQIIPIWTRHSEVEQEVNEVFDRKANQFSVQIAIRPQEQATLHEGKNCYENLLRELFQDSNIILFIPNINSVRVLIHGNQEQTCYRNSREWIVNHYVADIPENLRHLVNETIERGNSRIPEKYQNFDCTKVSFACRHAGPEVQPIDAATVYCYLPTKASWGLPFLMNTDMIPSGDRNDIETEVQLRGEEDINFNEELATIAGHLFFSWVTDLLASQKYHPGSVFSLIPDFCRCKTEHQDYLPFIEKFETAFCTRLEQEAIVPVLPYRFVSVYQVILDTTTLSTSGIMTDNEFCRFTNREQYALPLPLLRTDKRFNDFLKRYAQPEQRFEKKNLKELIANEDFQEWLQVQEHNDRFLRFLLERGYLADLLEEEIFLEAEGGLYAASSLYYDVDAYLEDLQAFTRFICYLSPKTREFFRDNKEWNQEITEAFLEFNGPAFVNNTLLKTNREFTISALQQKETSLHFYKFLAEHIPFSKEYMQLPFVDDTGEVVENFHTCITFFTSEYGHQICDSGWMANVPVAFLAADYSDVAKQYLNAHFGVQEFSDDLLIQEVILSDNWQKRIQDAMTDMNSSRDFVHYCFAHQELLEDGDLGHYALQAYDGTGEPEMCLGDDNLYFPSARYDTYAAKPWMAPEWMYQLNEEYFISAADKQGLKKFLQSAFGVQELTEQAFYLNVVKEHLEEIIQNTSGQNDPDGSKNIDFILYLDDNYSLIFEENHDASLFKKVILVSNDLCDLTIDERVYVYNDDLATVLAQEWFPQDVVSMAHKKMGQSRALLAMGCSSYRFGDFYDRVIVPEIEAVNRAITTKEQSIAFHTFITKHLGTLTPDQQANMVRAKVYLYGQEEAVTPAGGHKILSAKAKELFRQGLVKAADLDIIDPEYAPQKNTEYWETRLGNSKFTVSHFFSWLEDNADDFSSTIQDRKLNLYFWRWLKANATPQNIAEQLPKLPVLLKNGTIEPGDKIVYFSDEYLGDTAIEASVKRYDSQALFLSPEYMTKQDNVADWKKFWTLVGIRYEILDILTETIIPNLSEIEDEALPRLIAEHRESLEKYYAKGLIPHLTELRVRTLNGQFCSLDEAVYIDCEKEEPFPYIELDNQISFGTAEERRLIKDIMDEIGGERVETLSDWQQHKIDRYLEMQEQNLEDVRAIHFRFIRDLSHIIQTGKETRKDMDRLEQIWLLDRQNQFCEPVTLTLGSVYKPRFDFENCGVEAHYVSDAYLKQSTDAVGRLFERQNVHIDFEEEDIDILEERKCAIYFWGTYLPGLRKRIDDIQDIIARHLLDERTCIPTEEGVKAPSELYYGKTVAAYVQALDDWRNTVPLTSLPEVRLADGSALFDRLPFRQNLDFRDCLHALLFINSQERRPQLLKWMIEKYDDSCDEAVEAYRNDERALWYNPQNELIQIKNLYALDRVLELEQNLGNHPRMVNPAYFPGGKEFRKACEILHIPTITSDDIIVDAQNGTRYTERNKDLMLYALALAAKINAANWMEPYNKYREKLQSLVLYRCQSILLTYKADKSITQALLKFYHSPDTSVFYFVDSLDGKHVFAPFATEFANYLGIGKQELSQEWIRNIMDSPEAALNSVREQNCLMLDEDFKNALNEIIPGIKQTLSGNMALERDTLAEDYHRPSVWVQPEQTPDRQPAGTEDYRLQKEPKATETPLPDKVEQEQPNDEQYIENNSPEDEYADMASEWDKIRDGEYETLLVYTLPETQTEPSPTTTARQVPERALDTPNARRVELSELTGENQMPQPIPAASVQAMRPRTITKTLNVQEPTEAEITAIHHILGGGLTPEQIADQNYLVQLRLYNDLKQRQLQPTATQEEFIKQANRKQHPLTNGKYIHKCSATGGIMYLSPSIWNKLSDERCIVCVYLGHKANEFMYFQSIAEILQWIADDSILIKLTGAEKVKVVETLYSGVLKGITGSAYTMIRINSNEQYNSLFANLLDSNSPQEGTDYEEY